MPDKGIDWGSLLALLVVAAVLWIRNIQCAVVSNGAIVNLDAVGTVPPCKSYI